MEHRNYLLLIFVTVFMMQFVVAEPTYQQSLPVNISVPCIIDGAFCTSASCNATIVNPDGITLRNNIPMLQNSSVFYTPLTANDTSVKGEYEFTVYCKQGNKETTKTLFFLVQPIAKKYGNSILTFDLTSTINIIILVLIGIIALVLFVVKEYIFSGAIMVLMGLFFMFNGINFVISAVIISVGVALAFKT